MGIKEFETKYSSNLLGPEWHEYLFESYKEFRENSKDKYKNEEFCKAEFTKQALDYFYEAMEYVFREGFGTESQTAKNTISSIKELLFGKQK